MSITTKKSKGIEYVYFQAGVGKTLYLGPKNDPNKIKSENVLQALDYIKIRNSDYSELEERLVSMLSQETRDQYLTKRIPDLQKLVDSYVSSLSATAKQQYLSRGKQKAVEPTRRRQLEQEVQEEILRTKKPHNPDFLKTVIPKTDPIKHAQALFTLAVESALLDIEEEAYVKVAKKLNSDYGIFFSDCSKHPEYLKNVLKELFPKSYSDIIISINSKLGIHFDDESLEKLEKQYGKKINKLLSPSEITFYLMPSDYYQKEHDRNISGKHLSNTINAKDSTSNKTKKSD